ncbi:hypothetical protein Tco_0152106 [Tanacetum coccineum]
MNEQSHYKQDKTKTKQSINVKHHIFNVRGDNDKTKQTPTRMLSVVRRSLKKETSTLGEIVSLNYIKSNNSSKPLPTPKASRTCKCLNFTGVGKSYDPPDNPNDQLKELTNLCTKLVARVTSLETELKKTKEVHGKALTKLVKKVKRLEDKLKSTNKRKKAKMVISDEEEVLVLEDPSKQGRMDEVEDTNVEKGYAGVEYDFDLTKQQVTPLKAQQVKVQSQETFEAELSVLSAAKILVETSKERVKTYNRRRRRSTDSSQVSTTAGLFSTAEDIQDTDEELAKKVQEEEKTKVLEQQEQERANLKAALNLQKRFDQERKAADDID